MFRRLALALGLAAAPLAAQTAPPAAAAPALRIVDTRVGTGAVAVAGQTVVVTYTGWLAADGKRGTKFDSSKDRGDGTFRFPLGAGRVIAGWDQGVAGMKVGGRRTLTVPPELGYGDAGAGDVIPPGATLIFDIALLGVE